MEPDIFPTPASPLGSMADYVEFLKASVLKDAVVHHTTLTARPRRLAPPLRRFPSAVADILQAAGVTALYSHQAEGIGKALDGDNVVVATPTASGKTLIYNVPVVTTLLENPARARALYLPAQGPGTGPIRRPAYPAPAPGRRPQRRHLRRRHPGAAAAADSRRAAKRAHHHAGHAARRAAGLP